MKIAQRLPALAVVLSLALSGCAWNEGGRGIGQYIDDKTVSARVEAALIADPIVSALNVQVETYGGTVQLSGFVDSKESAQRAEELARRVPGVTEVRNAMVVR